MNNMTFEQDTETEDRMNAVLFNHPMRDTCENYWCGITDRKTGNRKNKCSEVGIYKRKQESKKTREHAFDQACDQEKKKKKVSTKKAIKKKR